MVASLKFFLGSDQQPGNDDNDSSSEDEGPNLRATLMAARVAKKTKKSIKKVDKAKAIAKKSRKKQKQKPVGDFSALQLLHDPQAMADDLVNKLLGGKNEKVEVRLLMLDVIARLIGVHSLCVPRFYPLLARLLSPNQNLVTKVMASAAQAAHPLVPPEDLKPVVDALAYNFITERCSNEAMAIGLNALTALVARAPHCINEDLVGDLAQYRSHRHKGVASSARGLVAVLREKNPAVLPKKDRGAPTELSAEAPVSAEFGQSNAKDHIPGAELLAFLSAPSEDTQENSDEGIDSDTDSDDDSDYEDIDDSDSDEEKEEETTNDGNMTTKTAIKEVMKMTPEERAQQAADIVSSRFLTDEDFRRIQTAQAAKKVQLHSASRKKRKKDSSPVREGHSDEIVTEDSIVRIYKKRCHDKMARLEFVLFYYFL